jgi:hypothetical protein
METSKYDGFYFLPLEDDDEGLKFSFFELKESDQGTPVEGNSIGDVYHIVMFKSGEDGLPVFNDFFEAILGDPAKYVENLIGTEIYGCVLRKTDKSGQWIEDYLTRVLGSVIIKKLKSYASSIAES